MYHAERNIRLVVHRDDFTALGKGKDLDWYRGMVLGKCAANVKGRIGRGKEDGKSMTVLNRVVHWREEGIEYEADQRHAEIDHAGSGTEGRQQEQ